MMSLRSRWFSAMSTRKGFFCSCNGTPCSERDAPGASSKSHARLKPNELPHYAAVGTASRVDEPQQLIRLLPHEWLTAARLHIEPHQGLGVGAAQVESPLGEFHRQSVGEVDGEGAALVLLPHAREDRGRGGAELPVDLAADGIEPHALAHERRERPTLCDHLQHDEPGDHAAVAVGECTEVVVRAHLAAIDAIDLPHLLLDESMTGLAEYRLAPMAADQVDGVPGETRVVHDTPASLPR